MGQGIMVGAMRRSGKRDARMNETDVVGQLVGFLTYRPSNGVLVLDHAEIDPACRGTGRGAQLVRGSLDDLMRRGFVIRPTCPFVVRFIEENPAYLGLLAR